MGRHIDECNEKGDVPNLMGMFQLIQIYLELYQRNEAKDDAEDEAEEETVTEEKGYLVKDQSLIELCWKRIGNDEINRDDSLSLLVSFRDRDAHFVDALKYKMWSIQGEFCSVAKDTTSALSHFANASSIHPFDETLWERIDDVYRNIQKA